MLRAHPVAVWHAESLPELVGALAGEIAEAIAGHLSAALEEVRALAEELAGTAVEPVLSEAAE
jgi:hypothetical protein